MPTLYSHEGIQPLDFDGDGVMDIAYMVAQEGTRTKFLRVLRHEGGVPDRLVRVNVSTLGPRVKVDYTTLADTDVHTSGGCTYPLMCPRRGGSIVAAHWIANGLDDPDPWHEYRHTYKAARTDLKGRGWLGFEEHTIVDGENGATTTTTFDNRTSQTIGGADQSVLVYPFAGRDGVVTYHVETDEDHVYERRVGSGYTLRPGAVPATYSMTLDAWLDFDQEVGPDGTEVLRVRSGEYEYDEFGSPTLSTVTINGGTRQTDDMSYRNDLTNWLIGLPDDRTTTSCVLPDGDCSTRHSTFDYDDNGNIERVEVEPDDDALFLRTEFGYGSFGNITSITATDSEDHSRVTTITYDDLALYPKTTTNPLNHVFRVDIHPGLGVPLTSYDPNGIQPATMKYDRFGRLREINHADGYFERFASLGPLFRLTTVPDGLGGATLGEAISWDKLGREREHSVPAFQGGLSATRSTYDRRGRLATASRPFLSGSNETIYQTIFQYDPLDRLRSIEDPDGATVRYEYIGLETHTHDAKGNHSYVVERGGNVESRYEDDPESTEWLRTRFEYGPFGLPSKITAADATTQTMTYDGRGRRLTLDDPSTGITTTTYNAFGEVTSETDASGGITTYIHDDLGRIKSITSPDGQATYKWDTAPNGSGRPVNSKSADGVGINYRYDPLGRPFTTT